ncbi:MAG: exosome complex RNA-binding protein Rrp4 [Thermoplasmata archaeon]|nr:exosome complex RNA-binding protein Rrp4 [Thermoplasmata archaeon]
MVQSDNVQRTDRVLVVPGDKLGDSSYKPGTGTFRKDSEIFAAQLGILNIRSGFINVIPAGGIYQPRQGDSVIGMVQDIGPSNWMVDINCPYTAFLHANETQWKVDFGTAGQYLGVGDIILAKIGQVDETKRVNLTMKEQGLRKMGSGQITKIAHTKVPRVIGKGGSMIALLKEHTGCRIFVGQNGVIWMDGEFEGMKKAAAAVQLIDHGTQLHGLTDSVREFLSGNGGASAGQSQPVGKMTFDIGIKRE